MGVRTLCGIQKRLGMENAFPMPRSLRLLPMLSLLRVAFRRVIDASFQHQMNMIVGDGVKNHLAAPVGLDQAVLAKLSQLVADGGLGHPQSGGQVAHTHFSPVQ